MNAAEWIGQQLNDPGVYDPSLDAPLHEKSPWPDAAWSMTPGVRFASPVSRWPVAQRRQHLAAFLKFPMRPLSARATIGFLGRTRESSLRFPEGLIENLEEHLDSLPMVPTAV
ncbi:hypothetical protein BH09GEM1_BH09GEM1_45620 [soil metagenome]